MYLKTEYFSRKSEDRKCMVDSKSCIRKELLLSFCSCSLCSHGHKMAAIAPGIRYTFKGEFLKGQVKLSFNLSLTLSQIMK